MIPLFDGKVDLSLLEVEADLMTQVGEKINKMIENDVVKQQIAAQGWSCYSIEDSNLSIALNLKNIVFVLVEKSSNFAQNTLRSVLKLILETAEQQRLTSITMGRIHRAGQLGSNDTEVASQTAKDVVSYLFTP